MKTISAERRARLRAYYLRRLGDLRQRLEAFEPRLASGNPRAVLDARSQLRDLAHQISGAAGSFGFSEVGEAAARLERAPEPEIAAALAEVLGRIDAALGAASPSIPPDGRC